jgi:diacylglycerol kinase
MTRSNNKHLVGKWLNKFGFAFSGLLTALRSESSFAVHLPATAGAVAWAAWLKLDAVRWSVLVICIGTVLSAELFNSSLERLARMLPGDMHHEQHHDQPFVKHALDMASGAVLVVSISAATVGLLLLVGPTVHQIW